MHERLTASVDDSRTSASVIRLNQLKNDPCGVGARLQKVRSRPSPASPRSSKKAPCSATTPRDAAAPSAATSSVRRSPTIPSRSRASSTANSRSPKTRSIWWRCSPRSSNGRTNPNASPSRHASGGPSPAIASVARSSRICSATRSICSAKRGLGRRPRRRRRLRTRRHHRSRHRHPAEELPPIPPSRARATPRKPRIPGTGLGLFVVKTLVEKHGGKLTVHSEVDRGSTFSVALPRSGAIERAPARRGRRRRRHPRPVHRLRTCSNWQCVREYKEPPNSISLRRRTIRRRHHRPRPPTRATPRLFALRWLVLTPQLIAIGGAKTLTGGTHPCRRPSLAADLLGTYLRSIASLHRALLREAGHAHARTFVRAPPRALHSLVFSTTFQRIRHPWRCEKSRRLLRACPASRW